MGNVLKLGNGGSIQVRTGVLAGVGPQGPRGLVGPAGPDGPTGPRGSEGPIGQILQMMSRATISAPFSVARTTDTYVSFGSVNYDDLSLFVSSSNMSLSDKNDYLFSVWIAFSLPGNTANGSRSVKLISSTNGLIALNSVPPVVGEVTYVNLTYPYRSTAPGEIVRVAVNHTDDLALNVSGGAVAISRIGSGPRGVAGPQGPQGSTGPQGPTGAQGPAGNAGSGFTTYADLL